ncbi:hypothetical protein PPERSA_01365 [Pseudocohnilembus persalinus]|uniref:inositol-1,3,4-trisphosphate 5/6-kinase n=1 Tax=Pseudocohnilembus persalinus TaxID=266149 RepID=A0A0V0QGY6_PSEPJ|nr:hypothetical protein PPERSA_01365 [Pseudocohnilembus persalinus]|eukprot:KRX01462.1 hypothetical protein PPERSA_01365 [Pseudocohnilembus persalinus]
MQNYERSDLLIPQFPMKYTPIDFRDSYENLNIQQNQQKQQYQQNTPLNIDVLLHKITQHIEHLYTSDPSKQNLKKNAENLMQNFYKFTDLYKKQVAIIDRMEKFEQIQNRGEFQKIFQAALTREQKFSQLQIKKNIIVKTPPYLEISADENKISNFSSICGQIEKKVGYPVIIKNREASAVANSHQMAVVLNQEGIPGVLQAPQFQNMPIIIQKLIQHDGKIFKIYCMGDFTDKQVRPSIPNITQDIIDNQKEKFWLFNSQKSFQEQLPLEVPSKIDNKDEITDNLDQETVVLVKDTLMKTFNFTVFGYDVLQEKKIDENGEKEEIWYICDMNYFPSFKDIPNMIQHFKNHFQNQKNLLNNHE